jgi:hypothetical protein
MNYDDALKVLNGKTRRKVKNNTYLLMVENDFEPTSIFLRLHTTNVVEWTKDGHIYLNSSGWRTVTTKDRMNWALNGYAVFSKDRVWYVRHNGINHEYEDGMDLSEL